MATQHHPLPGRRHRAMAEAAAEPSSVRAPIAVIGLACRLPQAPDPAAFWRLLRGAGSAIATMPPDRQASRPWPGGFLDDVASFDAGFFGISPREAVAMDPQQRLMLELTWEALEDAGIRPSSVAGSSTGIFVGAIWDDYAGVLRRSGLHATNRHVMTGVHRSMIANRVSYSYHLTGPSLTIDTGQSSSLVAVHAAGASLHRGECELALAAGVNLILAEDSMELTAQLGALSADGRCYTFDARANGFVRGEGGGAVLLKPLEAALRDGDTVYCVILGSAVNNDGSTDALTVPSAAAQEDVLRRAYHAAGVAPADVQYVELHGTGTPAGDPVEAAALGAVAGAARAGGQPLAVGSVKTNIGHLEAAGGIAGLIKTALSMRHGELPPSLNFSEPNPRIPLEALGLRVQDRATGWPRPDRPLLAGVSSFGMGGTNCHVVLGQAPAPPPGEPANPVSAAGRSTADIPWPLCGPTPEALAAQAGRLRRHVEAHPDADHADIGYSLGTTRSAFAHRAVVFGRDTRERLDRLAALERGADGVGPVRDRVTEAGVALLFGGHGPQRETTGRALRAAQPAFAQALDEARSLLGQIPYAEAAVFALDVALYRLAESWGLAADFVLGDATGEVAALHAAGVLSVRDACALVVARSRLVAAPPEDAALDELRGVVSRLSFAEPVVPVVSGLTGRLTATEELADPDYWIEQARRPGRLESGLRLLHDSGVATFLELGPDARLSARANECLGGRTTAGRPDPVAFAALPETAGFAEAMAWVYARGAELDWERVFVGRGARRVSLPTYAFQRSRHWPDAAPSPTPGAAPGPAPDAATESPASGASPAPVYSSFVQRLAGLDEAGRDQALREAVLTEAARVLGHATPTAIDPGLTFKRLGFDSLAGTELSQRLGMATGLTLHTSLIFDHPTPNDVVAHLRNVVLGRRSAVPGRRSVGGDEPVAIVGMACRYPGGVASPEGLWDLVTGQVDAVGEFPVNRDWDLEECDFVRAGGFLHDADQFDAGFFGISPREALAMDPQQRLLLETGWQALERAGIEPATLRGTSTGVYIGATAQDYGPRMHEAADDLDGHLLTGTTPSVMAGRLAYTFGFEGPALTVDTACSSSLVALHLAGQALRQGECSLAVAGGATVMATPGMFVEFSRQRGLAGDGRCKAFAASADGTGWAEGVGVVVLERLSDARRNGHQVLAVIRGSAINQDGASNGLTAPNGPAQERVIRQALANARLSPAEVDVVEAHGTGTTLGDPIEAHALLATYGKDRPGDTPLWLGSIKSNIGHTQAAAGVAGVIKMVMAMQRGLLPATLHVDAPSPHVDWSAGAVQLLTEPREWPRADRPWRAGVSSFGISGTNAHLILEQAPKRGAAEPSAGVWILSAKSPGGLRAEARVLAEHLSANPELTAAAVESSLIRTRSVLEHRAVVVGRDRDRLLEGLTALGDGAPDPDVLIGAAAHPAAPVLVFPGQGSQWAGMGAHLLQSSPVFAARIAECEQALAPYVDWSLGQVLRGDGAPLSRVDVVQPVLWAMMVALAAEWTGHGVAPAAVVGHSQGEIAAACVAGALSLDDAAKVVALRSRALRQLSGRGAMASLLVAEADARELTGPAADVVVAAVNSPAATVISGPPGQVAAVVTAAQGGGIRARLIDVDYASHGPQVDQVTEELTAALAGIVPSAAAVPFYSTVTGLRTDTTGLDAGYWATNLRQPVRFAGAVTALLADGHQVFVEASPNPVLLAAIEECAEEAGSPATALPTLRRDQGAPEDLTKALARAFCAGVDVDWSSFHPAGPPPEIIGLPATTFQRRRYWLTARPAAADPADLGLRPTGHPVLGAGFEPAEGEGIVLTGRVAPQRPPWLADHLIADAMLVPGAAQLEWVLRAADEVGCGTVEELVVHAPLAVPRPGGLQLQVVVGAAADDGRRPVGVYARSGTEWSRHATGVLLTGEPPVDEAPAPGPWPPTGAQPVDLSGFYAGAAAAGYGYGSAFQGLRAVWWQGPDIFAEIEAPESARDHERYGIHPALLDAALHPLLIGRLDDTAVWLPFAWTNVALRATGATSVRVRLSPTGPDPDRPVRLTVTDPAGGPVLDAEVTLRRADRERLRSAADRAPAGRSGAGNGGTVPRRSAAPAGPAQQEDWAHRLAAGTAGERQRMVLDLVRGHSAAVLGHVAPAEVPPDATYTDLGLGSVMAVDLRDRLVSATGLSLPVALIFGHPTPRGVADELLRRLGGVDGAAPASTPHRERDGGQEGEVMDRLRSASAEQVLDFIDNELGAL
jgi:acyl transferase domain-containing protein